MKLRAFFESYPALFGVVIGVLVVLAVAFLLPKNNRRLVRGPVILLMVFAVARGAVRFLPEGQMAAKALLFVAVFAWCTAIVRSLFVVVAHSRISRFAGKPWPKILRDVVQGFLYFGTALIALRATGVEPGSLLTTSALLTAVLGLSMQETLGNLFAGLALQGQQTLTVGDWVRFADGPEGLGEVTEVNWRATHFLTNTRVQVIVPNGVIARSIVKNYSRPNRIVRHDAEIVLPHRVSPEQARELFLSSLVGVPGVLVEPEPFIVLGAFNDMGITYSVRYFIDDYGGREPIEGEVRQRVVYALRRAGIELPIPGRRLEGTGALALGVPASNAPRPASRPPEANGKSLGLRLGRFDLFQSLAPEELARLAEGSQAWLYSPGEAIIKQGEAGTELYALERGRVEVMVGVDGRPPVSVTTLEAGAVFGEAALLTGERRSATIVARSECEVLAVSRGAFQRLLESAPNLSERFTSVLAERLGRLGQAVSEASDGPTQDASRRRDLLLERIRQFFAG